jgi:hypothetical protein
MAPLVEHMAEIAKEKDRTPDSLGQETGRGSRTVGEE